jgi:hypothetical protein
MIQLSELLGQEIQQISGVNEELLGSAQDDKAGILSMLRQGAGLTTLQGLFDNLDFATKKSNPLEEMDRGYHLNRVMKKCPDCGADVGETHKDGCDRPLCSFCEEPRASCECEE